MNNDNESKDSGNLIAIVGAAGRFPGAPNLDEYWKNLCAGVESVRVFSDEELLAAGESPEALADPAYVRAWPVLEGMELFDPGFFGMSPRDASVMDPQHRMFLELAWEAMEDAGHDPESARGPVGVFASNGMNTYMMHHLVTNREVMENVGEWLVRHTGNDMNFLATRVSYQMNLKGPSLNVQTACSSSMVAVHLACQSLLSGECDMALAGASAFALPQDRGYLFKQGEILSSDGHCRPFDANSSGTLFGSGAGCVVLRRLQDALDDGDRVLAVIRGSAINNDGSIKIGYLAPSVDGQAQAIREAIALSGVDAESITYIEAHGTGTALGDPIEVAALTSAFASYTDARGFCALGSVKANIGHLGEAAGMAGLLKTVLALRHRKLPPTINYDRPNPEIDFANSPVFVNKQLTEWKSRGQEPRRAGITSLGAGGTNAHVILEEAPPSLPGSGPKREQQLLVLSAKTASALEAASDRLATYLEQNPDVPLADVAHTLQIGRKAMEHRRALSARSSRDAASVLRSRDGKRLVSHQARGTQPSVMFMFPGGGAQYPDMGRGLYETEPVYREAFDACLKTLEPSLANQLRGLILPRPADAERAGLELERPTLSVLSVFVAEYAMAKLLLSWGIQPVAMIGHSMGEYAAACLAGVFSLKDALALLRLRGKLFEAVPPGAMLSVPLPAAEVEPLLAHPLCLAVINSPSMCVVSGPEAAIASFEQQLLQKEVDCTRVRISVAAHSSMLDPVLGEFEAFCKKLSLSPPTIPFMSNLTGTWITPDEATDPRYWVRHLRGTVRFSDGLAEALRGGERVLLEVGPGRALSSFARQQPSQPPAWPTMRHVKETIPDAEFALQVVGRLWTHGAKLDWKLLHAGENRRRVALPTYPFERKPYWVARGDALAAAARTASKVTRKKAEVADWFYLPSMRHSVTPATPLAGKWLVFADATGLASKLIEQLGSDNVLQVFPGERFAKYDGNRYSIRPGHREDYTAMFEDLAMTGFAPAQIVHLWGVTAPARKPLLNRNWSELERYASTQSFYFDSLLYLGQEFAEREEPIVLSVVANGLFALPNEQHGAAPEKALMLGPARVIPREMPHVRTRVIDVAWPPPGKRAVDLRSRAPGHASTDSVDSLLAELRAEPRESNVVYRGRQRFVPALDNVRLESSVEGGASLRQQGVYLITGGLGGIGLEVAEQLARLCKARLALLGRSGVPPKEGWNAWLAENGPEETTSRRIRKLQAIEALGGEVLTLAADTTNREQMAEVLATVRQRFGALHGVIHSAGQIDDGLIALKAIETARAVIDAKARGALVLDALLAEHPLDFFVVFSSVSSILGLEGQVDYTAANAFLDAFARRRSQQGKRTLSINWNAWQQVGMAVQLAERQATPASQADRARPHPMLARVVEDGSSATLFATSFNRVDYWLLSEHVVRGADALIPGTGYLELARAGLCYRVEPRPVEISNVFFLAPFAVRLGEQRDLFLRVTREQGDSGEFTFYSSSEEAPHVTGRIGYVDKPLPAALDVAAIAARCTQRVREFNGFLDQPFVEFGPRWGNVRSVHEGAGEALIRIALPAEYTGDLGEFKLHPAMLDMATGGAQALIPGFDQSSDFFVPFSYQRLTLFSGLPAQFVSYVRYRPNGSKELASFDITLADPQGNVVALIEGFTMKRVEQAAAMRGDSTRGAATKVSRLGSIVQTGIQPEEGVDALMRMLNSPVDGQVVACSVDLEAWIARVQEEATARSGGGSSEDGERGAFERPELQAEFIAPRDIVEEELARMWRELLGVSQVGINDDFFELGGQSLIAVRLFNRIRKLYGVDLPLSTLFEAPTIAGCASIIRQETGRTLDLNASKIEAAPVAAASTEVAEPQSETTNGSSPRPLKRSRWASLVAMQPKGELSPFFMVAGMGGTLNNLRGIALHMGEKRPVYGLQPPGAAQGQERLYSVEELAAHYLREIRAVQPEGPYFLGGYSGGGVAAFEMAKQLEAVGQATEFLGFLDSYSPHLPQRSLGARAQLHFERLQRQGPQYLKNTLMGRFYFQTAEAERYLKRALGKAFPEKYRYENLADSWRIAEGSYNPTAWRGKATLFRAREESALSLWTAYEVDEKHGWERYVLGGVERVYCAGNHTTMCIEPYVKSLARLISEAIERAAPTSAAPSVVTHSQAVVASAL